MAGTSQHMFVEFVSSAAGPLLNTGFHFNVGNWPGHVDTAGSKSGACDWMLSSDALKGFYLHLLSLLLWINFCNKIVY